MSVEPHRKVDEDGDVRARSALVRGYQDQRRFWPWYALGAAAAATAGIAAASLDKLGSLPINALGEVVGNLLVAGLVAPFARRAYQRRVGREYKAGFPYDKFLGSLRHAQRQVQILDTFSYLLIRDGSAPANGEGARGSRRSVEFVELLAAALVNDVNVRILILDPDSPEVEPRAAALGAEPDVYRALIAANLTELRALHGLVPEASFEVRLYTASPGISMHRCDSRLWVSFYPIDGRALSSPHLELAANTGNATFLKSRFNDLWDNGRRLW